MSPTTFTQTEAGHIIGQWPPEIRCYVAIAYCLEPCLRQRVNDQHKTSSTGLHSGSSQRLATARRRAMDRPAWRLLVDAAIRPRDTSQRERERERERQDKWFVPCSTDRCRQREFDIRGRRLRANYIQALLPVISGRLNYTRNTCQVGPK